MKGKNHIISLTLSAMLLAVGLVLPLLTGQIKQIGSALLPMHIPVLLCGMLCGPYYGVIVGFIMPLMRNMIFHMPPMPNAISMAFELAAYGLVVGIVYKRLKCSHVLSLYISMIISMAAGRAVWGVAQFVIFRISGSAFTLKMFLTGALFNSVPGIILQLILVPAIMIVLDKTGAVPFARKGQ